MEDGGVGDDDVVAIFALLEQGSVDLIEKFNGLDGLDVGLQSGEMVFSLEFEVSALHFGRIMRIRYRISVSFFPTCEMM